MLTATDWESSMKPDSAENQSGPADYRNNRRTEVPQASEQRDEKRASREALFQTR